MTYSSLPHEEIDWSDENLDFVGVNLYKDISNWFTYEEKLKKYQSHGKPVAITEFGTSSYLGAPLQGGNSHSVIDPQKWRLHPLMPVFRSEKTQAKYLEELIRLYEKHEIDAHFIFEYVDHNFPHDEKNPNKSLDTGTLAITKRHPSGKREPKQAFHAVKKLYSPKE